MIYKKIPLLLLCMSILWAPGCGSSAQKKEADPLAKIEGTIPIKVGQQFQVRLPANPTGGYGWSTKELDVDYLKHVSGTYEQMPTAQATQEVGGHETWIFQALKKGTTNIALVYKQQWRQDVTPARTYTAQIEIS